MKRLWNSFSTFVFRVRMKCQKLTRGYTDVEVWDLGRETLYWMLPRLKHYRKIMCGYPGQFISAEQWENYIDELIAAIELLKADNDMTLPPDENGNQRYGLNEQEYKQIEKALHLLGFWILAIWD